MWTVSGTSKEAKLSVLYLEYFRCVILPSVSLSFVSRKAMNSPLYSSLFLLTRAESELLDSLPSVNMFAYTVKSGCGYSSTRLLRWATVFVPVYQHRKGIDLSNSSKIVGDLPLFTLLVLKLSPTCCVTDHVINRQVR